MSECAPLNSPPPRSLLPSARESEPISRTLTGLLPFASAGASGGRSVLIAFASKDLMLPFSSR